MMRIGERVLVESRTDWLALEVLYLAKFLHVDVRSELDLVREVCRIFTEQTDMLIAKAF